MYHKQKNFLNSFFLQLIFLLRGLFPLLFERRKISRNNDSLTFVVTRITHCHSLYYTLSFAVIRCHSFYHSLWLFVTQCITRTYDFSMILSFSSKVSFYVSLFEINCIKIQTMSLVLNLFLQRFFVVFFTLTSSFASDWEKVQASWTFFGMVEKWDPVLRPQNSQEPQELGTLGKSLLPFDLQNLNTQNFETEAETKASLNYINEQSQTKAENCVYLSEVYRFVIKTPVFAIDIPK